MFVRTVLGMLAALALFACSPAASDTTVRQALADHPDMVLEALAKQKQNLYAMVLAGQQESQQAARQAQMAEELKKPLSPVIDPDRAMRGPKNAPVTVVVYSDFLCPHCAQGSVTLKEFMARHPDTVRALFKHYATDDLSREAALLYEALAVQNPELAFAFHDAVFENQHEIEQAGAPALYALAVKLDADIPRLKRDLKNPALAKRIDDDVAEARAYGIEGTPTFLLNGVSLRGAVPIEDFESVLRQVVPHKGGEEAPCDTCNKKKK